MKHKAFIVIMILFFYSGWAVAETDPVTDELKALQIKTEQLQHEVQTLQAQMHQQQRKKQLAKRQRVKSQKKEPSTSHSSLVKVRLPNLHPTKVEFYPTALVADNQVVTYIAGTPVVTSPYLGSRPAFDGSDYIVNISSINRDIRLMEQRRHLYAEYKRIGYPQPDVPIVTLSGKVEALGSINQPFVGPMVGSLNLGTSELDAAAALNDKVEGFIGFAYNESPQILGVPRVANSGVVLNMGFVNIGNLDKSPWYFTGGQLYVPYGRFSTSMVSSTLPMLLGRTKSRPFILGYKSQQSQGPFAAIYGFQGDTTLSGTGVGGVNLGYVFEGAHGRGELGASYITSINNATAMQLNGSAPATTFGGFASITNGSEMVKKIPGLDVHGYANIDRFSITAEWVTSMGAFRPQDLSFNGQGAKPQAGQVEGGVTFNLFNRPSSAAVGYQWTKNALALNLPQRRVNGVFSISIWRDTVESLEYRHDMDYSTLSYANGAAPPGVVNMNTIGSGSSSDSLLLQIGVYF